MHDCRKPTLVALGPARLSCLWPTGTATLAFQDQSLGKQASPTGPTGTTALVPLGAGPVVSGATGLAFEIIEVLPLDPRNKVAIAIIIIITIILTNIIRRRCAPGTLPGFSRTGRPSPKDGTSWRGNTPPHFGTVRQWLWSGRLGLLWVTESGLTLPRQRGRSGTPGPEGSAFTRGTWSAGVIRS